MKTKAIPKGKAVAKYWTKAEFEKVLGQISTEGFYEYCLYVMLIFYYRIGVRVSEGFALTWNDIDWLIKKLEFFILCIIRIRIIIKLRNKSRKTNYYPR